MTPTRLLRTGAPLSICVLLAAGCGGSSGAAVADWERKKALQRSRGPETPVTSPGRLLYDLCRLERIPLTEQVDSLSGAWTLRANSG